MPKGGKPTPPADRFWSNVQKGQPDECWLWIGTLTKRDGYPIMWDGTYNGNGNPHMVRAMRWAVVNIFGWTPLDRQTHVLHRCDTPRCCNPGHVYAGSHSQNMKDRARSGYVPVNKKGAA